MIVTEVFIKLFQLYYVFAHCHCKMLGGSSTQTREEKQNVVDKLKEKYF